MLTHSCEAIDRLVTFEQEGLSKKFLIGGVRFTKQLFVDEVERQARTRQSLIFRNVGWLYRPKQRLRQSSLRKVDDLRAHKGSGASYQYPKPLCLPKRGVCIATALEDYGGNVGTLWWNCVNARPLNSTSWTTLGTQ